MVSETRADGDDHFQAYHGDIGRISGMSGSPVAPATVIRQVAAAATQPPAVAAPVAPVPVVRQHQHQHQAASGPARANPNAGRRRITLAVRQHAPIAGELNVGNAPQPAQPVQLVTAAPASPVTHADTQPTFTQLSPPPQFRPAPAPEQPRAAVSFGHHFDQHANHQQLLQPQALGAPQHQLGPALASFRNAGSGSGLAHSVSARHSALIAQVAAEREAAAAAAGGGSNAPEHLAAPSLGSPLEALSQPAVAQAQPPQPPLLGEPAAAASPALTFVNQPEEPIVAPSFEHVLSHGCPHKGLFSYENKDHCDRYYMCTNGTFTEEACPNGLAYSQMGAVYQHCAYNWNVDCGAKKTAGPLASPGCPWQFGIFPVSAAGRCSIDYFVCEWGVPETKRCSPEGLFYDDRIKGCQWADQLGCKSEALLNFKCPPEDEDNPFWPYPRYYHTNKDVIVCVNEQPRLVHCTDEQVVEPTSLACIDLKKKKKKF